MASVSHNFNSPTLLIQIILHTKNSQVVSWSALYVMGEPIVGTSRVRGLHKV